MWKIQLEDVDIGIRKGNLAPNFTLLDLEGNEVELSDFIGKIGGRFRTISSICLPDLLHD